VQVHQLRPGKRAVQRVEPRQRGDRPAQGEPAAPGGAVSRQVQHPHDHVAVAALLVHVPRVEREREVMHLLGVEADALAPRRHLYRPGAEQVHHFAFSLNPRYVYEQGRYGDVVVRVLYLPGDSATWGRGLALGRTITALAWLDSLYGTFAWPQLMNLHRIDRGSTEFPMM